ncbi:hypothetical protein FGO68_gene4202 [Halteria grandinella]|uniref:Uncharacterized protein n=1 Tax=Halteria grandinella TaxID=5974 RepID=A0A8J8P966_HALGN|nr:hypothetical protein FGO68_gene4202 [Halteria grandinella]
MLFGYFLSIFVTEILTKMQKRSSTQRASESSSKSTSFMIYLRDEENLPWRFYLIEFFLDFLIVVPPSDLSNPYSQAFNFACFSLLTLCSLVIIWLALISSLNALSSLCVQPSQLSPAASLSPNNPLVNMPPLEPIDADILNCSFVAFLQSSFPTS